MFVSIMALAVLYQQPEDARLVLLPFLAAVLVVTFLVILGINLLIDAIWEGSPLWPRTSRVVRRAGAVIFLPMVVLLSNGAIAQWDADPARALFAGGLALALFWIAVMVALDRTWKGSRRE